MLGINKLSFWEKELYFEDIDYTIIGAGIVGYSTAISLREQFPKAKILIIERGYLPTGASTKNAGFACFGSPTEVLDDIQENGEEAVIQLINKRWKGLQLLLKRVGKSIIDFQENGSYEIFTADEASTFLRVTQKIPYLNKLVEKAIGKRDAYSEIENSTFNFSSIAGIIKNKYEGQINTGLMVNELHKIAVQHDIKIIFGVTLKTWSDKKSNVQLNTTIGDFLTKRLIIATNGLSKSILPKEDVTPARAQVIVTKPLKKTPFEGTFHYDSGFYYFRNIGNRILLGGGRNLDILGETTTDMENTILITDKLKSLLSEVILPNVSHEIDYSWSGIMGVGTTKAPIVKKISENVAIGIRLGGMGVALGSLVGEELSLLIEEK